MRGVPPQFHVWLLRSRLRAAWAGLRRSRSPMPSRCRSRHDAAYHLDAGDRLRVVVYGQEGLTNTYAIDAGGSITLPLIGAVPARGRTTAGLAAEISARLRRGFIREPSVAVEIESLPAVLHPRRSGGAGPISLCSQHDR